MTIGEMTGVCSLCVLCTAGVGIPLGVALVSMRREIDVLKTTVNSNDLKSEIAKMNTKLDDVRERLARMEGPVHA